MEKHKEAFKSNFSRLKESFKKRQWKEGSSASISPLAQSPRIFYENFYNPLCNILNIFDDLFKLDSEQQEAFLAKIGLMDALYFIYHYLSVTEYCEQHRQKIEANSPRNKKAEDDKDKNVIKILELTTNQYKTMLMLLTIISKIYSKRNYHIEDKFILLRIQASLPIFLRRIYLKAAEDKRERITFQKYLQQKVDYPISSVQADLKPEYTPTPRGNQRLPAYLEQIHKGLTERITSEGEFREFRIRYSTEMYCREGVLLNLNCSSIEVHVLYKDRSILRFNGQSPIANYSSGEETAEKAFLNSILRYWELGEIVLKRDIRVEGVENFDSKRGEVVAMFLIQPKFKKYLDIHRELVDLRSAGHKAIKSITAQLKTGRVLTDKANSLVNNIQVLEDFLDELSKKADIAQLVEKKAMENFIRLDEESKRIDQALKRPHARYSETHKELYAAREKLRKSFESHALLSLGFANEREYQKFIEASERIKKLDFNLDEREYTKQRDRKEKDLLSKESHRSSSRDEHRAESSSRGLSRDERRAGSSSKASSRDERIQMMEEGKEEDRKRKREEKAEGFHKERCREEDSKHEETSEASDVLMADVSGENHHRQGEYGENGGDKKRKREDGENGGGKKRKREDGENGGDKRPKHEDKVVTPEVTTNADLEEKLKKAEEDNRLLQQRLERAQQALESKEQALQATQQVLASKEQALQATQQALDATKQIVDFVKEQGNREELQKSQAGNREEQHQLRTVNEKLKRAVSEINKLTAKLKEAKEDLSGLEAENKLVYEESNKKLAASQSENNKLSAQLKENEVALVTVRSELSDQTAQLESASGRLVESQAETAHLRAELESVNSKMTESQAGNDELNRQLNVVKEEKNKLVSQIEQMETTQKELMQSIADKEVEIESLGRQITARGVDEQKTQILMDDLSRVKDIEEQYKELEKELDEKREEIDKLQDKVKTLEYSVQKLTSENEALRSSNRGYKNTNDMLRKANTALNNKNAALNRDAGSRQPPGKAYPKSPFYSGGGPG